MIRCLNHSEINFTRWNDCLSNCASGNIYGYSWYLDIICDGGWDGLVEDDYLSVMPLPRRKKYGQHYLYPPFFAQQTGIYSQKVTDKDTDAAFLDSIPEKFRFIELNLNIGNTGVPASFEKITRPDYILDLNRNYEEIRKGYSDHHERNIKKSLQNDLTLFRSADASDIIAMFRKHRGQQVANLHEGDYERFARLINVVTNNASCRIWSVSDRNGIPCAGAVFFESGSKAYFIFSALTPDGRDQGAMYFLIDSYIREMAGRLAAFDFEGSADEGIARFYRGFGALEFIYLHIRRNELPAPWKWFKK